MDQFNEYFEKYSELKDKKIAIAFSGGSDSLALLYMLSQKFNSKNLIALYVNHGLRDSKELSVESKINRENCLSLGVEYKEFILEKGEIEKLAKERNNGIEDAARFMRYNKLLSFCKENGYYALSTAHTIDDQLETMIMRTFNGASLLSLTCIKDMREQDSIKIIRPLLKYSKDDLRLKLKVAGLIWSEDTTNRSTDYLRNRIRKEISPKVESIFPDVKQIVYRNAQLFTGLVSIAQEKVNKMIESNIVNRKEYLLQEDIIRYNILSKLIKNFEVPSFKKIVHIDNVIKQKKEGYEKFGNIELLIKDDSFVINKFDSISQFSYVVEKIEDQTISVFDNKLIINSAENEDSTLLRIADEDISLPLIVRNLRSDDFLVTDGGTVDISKFLSNWKLKESDRKKVVVLEDRNGIVALFAKHLGGRDRLTNRVKTPLVGKTVRIYSIV
ncbi:MAG: tRNA lysidine(34) synthetase TilS [Sphaerochaetaceae bacterium]|nr:tRNA lysidine(34) synthetase TilS [Sphaerochaetaceae bacterium]MDC7238033.1 tRNA lysidine(34) synthetase TilS [Sphaerochaetaceae bacterium]